MKNITLLFVLLISYAFAQKIEIRQIQTDRAVILATGLEEGQGYTLSFQGQVYSFRTTIDSSQYVLFNNFNHLPLGGYDAAQWKLDWKNSPRWGWEIGRDETVSITDSNTIRVEYPQGRYGLEPGGTNGALWYSDLEEGYDELYLTFKVYFEGNFDWRKGGKFHGLKWGGFNGAGEVPCEGGYIVNKWIENGGMVLLVYHPAQKTIWGDDIPLPNVQLQPNRWYSITNYIKLNSGLDYNGQIKTWVDGQLVLDQSGFRFRVNNSIKIDEFDFSTFFGGGDQSFAPATDQYIQFDDFKITTQPLK